MPNSGLFGNGTLDGHALSVILKRGARSSGHACLGIRDNSQIVITPRRSYFILRAIRCFAINEATFWSNCIKIIILKCLMQFCFQ